VIDCDVHAPGPPLQALLDYLPEYWQMYVREVFLRGESSGTGRLHVTAGAGFTYPAWAKGLAAAPEDLTLDAIRTNVLDGCELGILNCYAGAESFTHPYFAPALATAVNRWLAEEWLDLDERLLGSAVIAPQHTASAVEEVERIAADPRFVQILLPARSSEPYGNQRYWPIWEAAAAHGLALAITYGGAATSAPTALNWPPSFYETYAAAPTQFGSHLASLVFSGILDRFPELKIVMVESGWTWLPHVLWRMDWEWKSQRREVPWVRDSPSDYVRRNFRFTTAPVDAPDDLRQLGEVIEQLESDEVLMYGSDYPRRYDVGVAELVGLLSEAQAERLLRENARECYGLGERVAVAAT
jgi:predicted TIM-barrel fold metal-dependent hydrolase